MARLSTFPLSISPVIYGYMKREIPVIREKLFFKIKDDNSSKAVVKSAVLSCFNKWSPVFFLIASYSRDFANGPISRLFIIFYNKISW